MEPGWEAARALPSLSVARRSLQQARMRALWLSIVDRMITASPPLRNSSLGHPHILILHVPLCRTLSLTILTPTLTLLLRTSGQARCSSERSTGASASALHASGCKGTLQCRAARHKPTLPGPRRCRPVEVPDLQQRAAGVLLPGVDPAAHQGWAGQAVGVGLSFTAWQGLIGPRV